MSKNGTERLMTIKQVGELLQVPPSWIYSHTRRRVRDRIPGFRLGKYWRFKEADVVDWLERQRVGTRTNP
jgi:excisionase family DNA binding protein